jgi:hypothetical protein
MSSNRCRNALRSAFDVREIDDDVSGTSAFAQALSCRSCLPNAQFAELVRPSQKNIADKMREERPRQERGVELRSTAPAVQSSPTSIMPK